MLNQLSPDQRRLADYMSNLSEEAYYAAWMRDLEYDLWKLVVGDARDYGRQTATDEQIEELMRLSEECGGWIVFDEVQGQTWISLPEWKRLYQNHINRQN